MKNVLVVDDEPDVEFLFLQRFRKEIKSGNIEFQFAFSTDEALEFLNKESAQDFLLVLSDINMPGMSGLELLDNIKKTYLKPPPVVMMITAYGDEENYTTAMSLGADDFLTKPLEFKLLKEKLKEIQ